MKIKELRIKKGLSQMEVYDKTGIQPYRLSLIERGLIPKREEAEKIAKLYSQDINSLFPLTDDTPRKRRRND